MSDILSQMKKSYISVFLIIICTSIFVSSCAASNTETKPAPIITASESAKAWMDDFQAKRAEILEEEAQSDIVYWVPAGEVWHNTPDCRTLSRSSNIQSGTIEESGKPRECGVCG